MKRKYLVPASFFMLFAILTWVVITSFFTKKSAPISPLGNSFSLLSKIGENKEKPKYLVYGYLPYWSMERVQYLQLDKLTDIAYFGLRIEKDGTFRKVIEDGLPEPGYAIWKNSKTLKKLISDAKKQDVRVSLTVISHEDEVSTAFLNCSPCWNNFINNLVKELNYHKIKDVNLNFEYVELTENDVANKYTQFVDYVNKQLDIRFGDSYLVTSTFADSLVKPRVTKISELSKVADGLFIMAYDFHRPTSETAGPVAPIEGAGIHAEYDIKTMLKDYLANSPPQKLIMGVPYYGYNWVVVPDGAYAERIEGNDNIGYSQSQAYSDVIETILEVKPEILWDELGQTPYFTYISPETGSTRQVFYENYDSLKIKYRITKSHNLAGIGIWALGYDEGYQELWNLLQEEFN
jgi:spore germination protein